MSGTVAWMFRSDINPDSQSGYKDRTSHWSLSDMWIYIHISITYISSHGYVTNKRKLLKGRIETRKENLCILRCCLFGSLQFHPCPPLRAKFIHVLVSYSVYVLWVYNLPIESYPILENSQLKEIGLLSCYPVILNPKILCSYCGTTIWQLCVLSNCHGSHQLMVRMLIYSIYYHEKCVSWGISIWGTSVEPRTVHVPLYIRVFVVYPHG